MQAAKNWCDGERVKKLRILMSSKQGPSTDQHTSSSSFMNSITIVVIGFKKKKHHSTHIRRRSKQQNKIVLPSTSLPPAHQFITSDHWQYSSFPTTKQYSVAPKDHWHQFSFCVVFLSLLFSFPQHEDRLEASIRVIVSVVCTKEEKERESTVKVNFGFLQLSFKRLWEMLEKLNLPLRLY
jgi:hypothetical protein